MEQWRQVGDWPYEVSDLGRIRRTEPACGTSVGKVIKPFTMQNGYLRINLLDAPRRSHFFVHRLVAEAFVPNPTGRPLVNHKDGNKGNPRADNLEWVTQEENQLHAVAMHGHYGSGAGRAKLTDEQVLAIRERYTGEWGQQARLAAEFGVTQMLISKIVHGNCWTHLPLGRYTGSPSKKGGAEHGRARLTDRQVRAIRRRHAEGATHHVLAAAYGISRHIIRDIVRRKTWRHIE